jgi:hypothetical protein
VKETVIVRDDFSCKILLMNLYSCEAFGAHHFGKKRSKSILYRVGVDCDRKEIKNS